MELAYVEPLFCDDRPEVAEAFPLRLLVGFFGLTRPVVCVALIRTPFDLNSDLVAKVAAKLLLNA